MSLQVACGHPPGPTPPADYAPSLALSLARSDRSDPPNACKRVYSGPCETGTFRETGRLHLCVPPALSA